MITKYKSINRIGITTIIGAVALEAVNFILIPILTRELGTSGYGVITLYVTWCAAIVAVCGLQTTQSIVYIVAEVDSPGRGGYYASMLSISALAFLFVGTFVTIGSYVNNGIGSFSTIIVILLFSQAFGTYCVNYVNTIFKQEQRPEKQLVISIFTAISTAVLSISLVTSIGNVDDKYYGRIIGYSIPYFLIGTAAFLWLVIPNAKRIRISYVKKLLPICLPIIIHSLAAIVFSQSDRVMLKYMSGIGDVGIYGYTYSIASLLSVVWVTLNSFFQPFLFSYMRNGDLETISKKTNNLLMLYTAVYAVFILVVPDFTAVYGGTEFADAAKYLPILCLGIYLNFLYTFNSNFEIYYKETKMIAKGTILSALINIALNSLLIPPIKVFGACIATLVSYIALFIFHYIGAKKTAKKKKVQYVYSIKILLAWCAVAIGFTILYYFTKQFSILRFVIGGVMLVAISVKTIMQRSII